MEPLDTHLRDAGYTLSGTDPVVATRGETALALEPLDEADPFLVVSRLQHAARHDRTCLFVCTPAVARDLRALLADPFLATVGPEGRIFAPMPDRIRLGPAGFACVERAPLEWREDEGRITLFADGTAKATFDDFASLSCPAPTAFPYAYRRVDGQFLVTRAGDPVGRYPSMRALKADFTPVPDPLVPERLLDTIPEWRIAVVDGDRVVVE